MKSFLLQIILLISVTYVPLSGQGISLTYERDLTDIDYLEGTYDSYAGQAILHTNNGFALYYGWEKIGFDDYIKLRNNNTLVWQTQIDNFPDNITPYKFYEHESGYFFVGDFALSSNTGGIGRLNKTTGNFEVKKRFTDLQSPATFAINGTHGGNIIVGGRIHTGGGIAGEKAMIRVVNLLGDELITRISHQTGGLWGSGVTQIEKTYDNGYIVSGYITENTVCFEPQNISWWICKLNSNLDVVWSRKYGDGNGTTKADKIVVLDNNEIVVLGQTYCTNGNGGGINNTGAGRWLLKLNSSGNITINKFVGINLLDYTKGYSDIELSCDGKLAMIGVQGGLLGSSYFIEKFDTNLELIDFTQSGFGIPEGDLITKINFQMGEDNSYLFYGLKHKFDENGVHTDEKSFIAKTIPDPGCGSNPGLLCNSNIGLYSICEDFDNLQTGNLLPQGSPKFSLFSENPIENSTVTTEKAFSATKSLKFTNTSDIDFNIGRIIESPTRLEWMTYLESGRTGSWGLETSSPSVYALVTNLNNGLGIVYIMNSNNQFEERATFAYTPGQWYKTALVFDNILNTIEVWVNNTLIYTRTTHTSRQITDLNFYATPGSNNNTFYIDDLLYYETKLTCICTLEYLPVCVNGKEFSNACRAVCAGYTSGEWTEGPCGGSNTRNITIDIDDNICGGRLSEIKVPVRVKDYKDIAGLQLRIASSNNNVAENVGVADINPNSGLTNVDFAVVSQKLVLTYADIAKTLPDNAVLFNIRVNLIGNVGQSANLLLEGEIFALDNDFKKVDVITNNGSVCISQSLSIISGLITTSKDKAIANVGVLTTSGNNIVATVNTNAQGSYSISNLMNGTNYKVSPTFDESLSKGVDITDLLLLRRHMQGLTLFNNPYTYLAADISSDKLIDITDLLLMRRIMQGLTTQLPNGQKAWRFVPKTYVFPSSGNPLAGTIPNSLEYNPLTSNRVDQNFIGVKYADIDHSNLSIQNVVVSSRTSNNVILFMNNVTGASGSTVTVDLKCNNFINGAAMQFSLTWPTDKLELVRVPAGSNEILMPGTSLFDQSLLNEGKLGFIWDTDDLVNGTTLSDGSVCFRLTFKLIGPNNSTADISSSTTPKSAKFLTNEIEEIPMEINSGRINIALSSATNEAELPLLKVYPNPTTGIIFFESSKKFDKNIEIYEVGGKYVNTYYCQENTLDLTGLNSGVYVVKLNVEGGYVYEKVVLVR
ncbi:MAG: T9SS type A sorting domain-containing protein [Saprospiraceae bacterium]